MGVETREKSWKPEAMVTICRSREEAYFLGLGVLAGSSESTLGVSLIHVEQESPRE